MEVDMVGYICSLVAIMFTLGGCATYHDANRERLEKLPQHYSQFDAVLAWQISNEDSQTVVDGEFKNIRYEFMNNIEVWVEALDASGKPVARSVSFILPNELKHDDIAPFGLELPVKAMPGTKLRFTYKYMGSDGGGSEGDGLNWMQSFDAEVPNQQ